MKKKLYGTCCVLALSLWANEPINPSDINEYEHLEESIQSIFGAGTEIEWSEDESGAFTIFHPEYGLFYSSVEVDAQVRFPMVEAAYHDGITVEVVVGNDSARFFSHTTGQWMEGLDEGTGEDFLRREQAAVGRLNAATVQLQDFITELQDTAVMLGDETMFDLREQAHATFLSSEFDLNEAGFFYGRVQQAVERGDESADPDTAREVYGNAVVLGATAQRLMFVEFETLFASKYGQYEQFATMTGVEHVRNAQPLPAPWERSMSGVVKVDGIKDVEWNDIEVIAGDYDPTECVDAPTVRLLQVDIFEGSILTTHPSMHLSFALEQWEDWFVDTEAERGADESAEEAEPVPVADLWMLVPKKHIESRNASGWYAFPIAAYEGGPNPLVTSNMSLHGTPLGEWRPSEYVMYGFFVAKRPTDQLLQGERTQVFFREIPKMEGLAPPIPLHFEQPLSSGDPVILEGDAINMEEVEFLRREGGRDTSIVKDYEVTAKLTGFRIHSGKHFSPYWGWYVDVHQEGAEEWTKWLPYAHENKPLSGNLWIFVPKPTGGWWAMPFEGYIANGPMRKHTLGNLNFHHYNVLKGTPLEFPWIPNTYDKYGWMISTNAGFYPGSNGQERSNIILQSFPRSDMVEDL